MSTRMFTGIPFIPKKKCEKCKYLEECEKNDQALTDKSLLLNFESFYHIFTKLEESEKYPIVLCLSFSLFYHMRAKNTILTLLHSTPQIHFAPTENH